MRCLPESQIKASYKSGIGLGYRVSAFLRFCVSLRALATFSQVSRCDTRKKTVLAERTHLPAMIHKPKQERPYHSSPRSTCAQHRQSRQQSGQDREDMIDLLPRVEARKTEPNRPVGDALLDAHRFQHVRLLQRPAAARSTAGGRVPLLCQQWLPSDRPTHCSQSSGTQHRANSPRGW